MPDTSLRETLEQARNDIKHYRQPNTRDARDLLAPILEAAGFGDVRDRHLASIGMDGSGMLSLQLEYGLRGSVITDELEIPEWIIDADDPIHEATLWGLQSKVGEARLHLQYARQELVEREEAFSMAVAAREEYVEAHGRSRANPETASAPGTLAGK